MADHQRAPSSRPVFTNPWKQPSSGGSQDVPDGRIAHTLTACTRCRQRKSRCDPGIPRCEPCERSNARCVYYDPARNCTIPRTWIVQLRERARALENEIERAQNDVQHAADAELMVRGAGRIKFHPTDEPRYLGPSSGISISRLVMEMAKQNTDSKSIKDVVPEITALEIRDMFAQESSKPTSKVYPMISSVPQENLPPQNLTSKLIDLYMVKGQAMHPTLHEPTFRQDVEDVFGGSTDSVQNFQVRIVIAISMQKLSTEYAGLADSYYLAALPFLEASLKPMDLKSLQCLALIAQYSLLTPTRTASYWVVGLAVKLAQELKLTEEATITKSPSGEPFNVLEIDMRRRLAWIVISMEFGLSHSLGRPSAFCMSHDHLDVKFFELVDDRFITPQGILPDSKPILAKCIAIHFFKMRLLQAEIRRTLYLNKRETPVDDQDPWFAQMVAKMDHWVASCPKHDGGTGFSESWYRGRTNIMVMMLYRPSPQIPEPSIHAARKSYEASAFNVGMHREQMATGSIDLTWVSTLSLIMAINTMLWTLSYPDIRKEHHLDEVQNYLRVALDGLMLAAPRWPGIESALRLYRSLIAACLKAYETADSFVVHSPSNQPSPASAHDIATPPPMSSPSSTTTNSFYSIKTVTPHHGMSDAGSHGTASRGPSAEPPHFSPAQPAAQPATIPVSQPPIKSSHPAARVPTDPTSLSQPLQEQPLYNETQPYTQFTANYLNPNFDPETPFNTFPSVVPGLHGWDPNYTAASTTAGGLAYVDAMVNPMFWLGAIGDQYSQYSDQPFTWRERTLSQQEQLELMDTLEDNIPDVSAQLVDESTIYYRS